MGKSSSSNNSSNNFLRLSGREKKIALVVLAFVLAGAWIPARIIVSTSPSLNHRIFFKVPVVKEKIKRGDYLVFPMEKKYSRFLKKGIRENDRMIKRVGCEPGDILTRYPQGFYCTTPDKTRIFLGMPLEKDSKGDKLPIFNVTGQIPPDNYFMVGDAARSFDSRYFGFVTAGDFITKAIPLW